MTRAATISLVFALGLAFQARASWISAGGGELFKDAHNPWFLKNVTSVNYCLDIAPNSVSASPETMMPNTANTMMALRTSSPSELLG